MYNIIRSRNQVCRVKAISISYSECVSVALVKQHAKRMHHIILSSVACPALPYSPALSHKRYGFRKRERERERERERRRELLFFNFSTTLV